MGRFCTVRQRVNEGATPLGSSSNENAASQTCVHSIRTGQQQEPPQQQKPPPPLPPPPPNRPSDQHDASMSLHAAGVSGSNAGARPPQIRTLRLRQSCPARPRAVVPAIAARHSTRHPAVLLEPRRSGRRESGTRACGGLAHRSRTAIPSPEFQRGTPAAVRCAGSPPGPPRNFARAAPRAKHPPLGRAGSTCSAPRARAPAPSGQGNRFTPPQSGKKPNFF